MISLAAFALVFISLTFAYAAGDAIGEARERKHQQLVRDREDAASVAAIDAAAEEYADRHGVGLNDHEPAFIAAPPKQLCASAVDEIGDVLVRTRMKP